MTLEKLIYELKVTADRLAANHAIGREQEPEDFVVLRGNTEAILSLVSSPPMFDLSAIQPASETIQKNQERLSGDQLPCAVCGRPVKTAAPIYIHMSERGNVYLASVSCEAAEELPEGSMYLHPVGPECARKIPPRYRHKPEEGAG